jgi:hypothetical protein
VEDIAGALGNTEAHNFDLRPWAPYIKHDGIDKLVKLFPKESLKMVSDLSRVNLHTGKSDSV